MTAAANASTTVILAGYPTEMQSALETDAGLASRIALAIELPMPTDEDLARTTHRLLETRSGGSFRTPYEMLASLLTGHFARLRADDVARFGGYRAADRLAERVRMNARIRHDGASGYRIEVEDVLKALQA
jgi:adenylate kinase family enzyme